METRTQETAAGATTLSAADIQGKIIETAWCLKREGYAESTILNYPKYLSWLVKHGANLYDPQNVKDVIARMEKWSTSSKLIAVGAYTFFASINNIPWKPPKYKQERKLPFIPLESEIDALISSAGKKTAAVLQLLKETGMRIGEACRLKWIDLDLEHKTVTVNQPEKNSQPRMLKMSTRLVAMLDNLPRENEHIFGLMKGKDAANYFYSLRKRVAYKLQNPRINSIHLHTFRHWNATMEYHKTKDILHVMKRLGHKRIENTLLYTQLVQFESDEYYSATAENLNDAKKLIEGGFEYVCTYQDTMLFKKRK
jgi:integrase